MYKFKKYCAVQKTFRFVVTLAIFTILILADFIGNYQTEAKLTGTFTSYKNGSFYDIEGKWTFVANKKDGSWKHSGDFNIIEFNDGYKVVFHSDNDNPKNVNQVSINGDGIVLDRNLSPFKDPNDGMSSQTWSGRLSEDDNGKLRIRGTITGAGMPLVLKMGYDTRFIATKQ